MITTLRRSTIALLASSLLLTIGRGATLPFMTIYLTRRYQLDVDVIGYALSLALVVGVLFSMGFGILADKFDKKRYMVWSVLVFILGFSAIPLVNNAILVVIFFALINCAYSVFSTVLKAWFADRLTPEKKGSSRMSGEGGFDLQKEVISVAVSVSHALDHFDLVVDPFKLAGMHRPAHSRQDASPVRFQR